MDPRAARQVIRAAASPNGARTFLVQDWITLRGAATTSQIVQDEEIDVGGFADGAFWVDVIEATPPGGTPTNYLQLILETSPSCDDAYFTPVTSPIWLGTGTTIPVRLASNTPFLVRSAQARSSTGLSRYLRWRIAPTGTGAWSATFRIRAALGRSSFFVPTQIPGCQLWLRSDLGVTTTVGANTISGWADQSGAAADAAPGISPTYSPAGGVFGLPKVSVASGQYLAGTFPTPGVTAHTVFAVLSYPASLNNYSAIAATNSSNNVNTGFSQFTATGTGILGRTAGTSLLADAVTADTSSLGLVGIYSTAADSSGSSNPNVDLWVNGTLKATTAVSFTLLTCPKYLLFTLAVPTQFLFVGDAYEFIVFNSVLSANDRKRVHRYLGARYGIAVP